MLTLTDVSRVYRSGEVEVVALRDVSLSIGDGEFVVIVGPSGSGKSTLLQILGLLDRPSRGRVTFDGQDVGAMDDAERTRLRLHALGFVFQRFHLLGDFTAIENVALPMEAAGMPPAERYDRAAWLLESVGLGDRLTFVPGQLSGGQRQRVAIARALANEPRIVLADEPTGALHSEDKVRVLELFRRVQRGGRTVVIVTHDPEIAANPGGVPPRRLEIRDGRVREVAA